MVQFFKKGSSTFYAVETDHRLDESEKEKLMWAFSGARPLSATAGTGSFIGPRREMITPWSTNAVEIAQNMGLKGITRIEQFTRLADGAEPRFDKMLMRHYAGLTSRIFTLDRKPEPIGKISANPTYTAQERQDLRTERET